MTAKQEKFVQELVKGKSQREAYKIAYNAENTSDKTVDECACKLLKDRKISARYEELMAEIRSRDVDEASEIRAKIIAHEKASAFVDVASFYDIDEEGNQIPKRIDELTPTQRMAIKEIRISGGKPVYKFNDRAVSMDRLERLFNLVDSTDKDNSLRIILSAEGYDE